MAKIPGVVQQVLFYALIAGITAAVGVIQHNLVAFGIPALYSAFIASVLGALVKMLQEMQPQGAQIASRGLDAPRGYLRRVLLG